LEVEVKSTARDPGAADDVRYVRAMVALAGENSLGVAQNLGAPSLPFHPVTLPKS